MKTSTINRSPIKDNNSQVITREFYISVHSGQVQHSDTCICDGYCGENSKCK